MLKHRDVDVTFRALAEPTRRAIVERLGAGPQTVTELARPFDMSLAAVMQHLQTLEDAGLVRSEKLGRVRTCTLQPDGLAPLRSWLEARRSNVERKFDRLGELLAESTTREDSDKENRP